MYFVTYVLSEQPEAFHNVGPLVQYRR